MERSTAPTWSVPLSVNRWFSNKSSIVVIASVSDWGISRSFAVGAYRKLAFARLNLSWSTCVSLWILSINHADCEPMCKPRDLLRTHVRNLRCAHDEIANGHVHFSRTRVFRLKLFEPRPYRRRFANSANTRCWCQASWRASFAKSI